VEFGYLVLFAAAVHPGISISRRTLPGCWTMRICRGHRQTRSRGSWKTG